MAKEMKMTKVEDNSAGTRVKRGVLTVVINFFLWFFSLTCIFPLFWMFYSSLKEKRVFNADVMGLPKDPTIANYTKILSNKDYRLMQSVFNSARTTILAVLLIVFIAFIVGYILSRIDFALNKPLYVMFLMGMLIPIHSLMVPIYIIFSKMGLSFAVCLVCTAHVDLSGAGLCEGHSDRT